MNRSIGHEPKNRSEGSSHRRGSYALKVPSDLIKVLPKLTSYRPAERLLFKDHLVAMLKSTGTTFLLKNEQRKVAATGPAPVKKRQALSTPFTPAPIRTAPSELSGSESEDSDAENVAQVLWHTPAHAYIRTPARAQKAQERSLNQEAHD